MKEYLLNLWHSIPYTDYFQNNYIASAAILIIFIVLAKLLLFIFGKYLQRWARKTKTKVDDLIFERTKSPLFYLILVYGVKLSLLNLGLNNQILTNIINSLLALVFIFIILRVFDVLIGAWGETFAKKTKTNLDDVLLPLFHKFAKVILAVVGFMWVLSIWEINITPYLAGVGVGGLVLGLALQDSLKNIFGGVSMILDKTLKVGDKIKIESGEVGEIHDVGLRSTKIKTYDNQIIVVPNGQLVNSRIQNYTKPNSKIRVTVQFGVEYGTEIKKVQDLVKKTVLSMKEIMVDPAPVVNFELMGDFALNFTAKFWVSNWSEAYGKKLEATEKIYNALNAAKINIPFPTSTVYLKK
jgi:MscS family membrane protein